MITNNFFYTLNSIQSFIITDSDCEYFLHEELPKNFRSKENIIYYKRIDRNFQYVFVFTIKNRVPIFHGILKYDIFMILLNTDFEARLKLKGTLLEHENVINIVNRCFRYTVHDADKIELKYF